MKELINATTIEELITETMLPRFNYCGSVLSRNVEIMHSAKSMEKLDFAQRHISGFIWGLYACNAISEEQRDNLLDDNIAIYSTILKTI